MTFTIKDANKQVIAVLDVPDADRELEELIAGEAADPRRWSDVDPALGEVAAIGTLVLSGYDVAVAFSPMDALEGRTADVPADARVLVLPAPLDAARLSDGIASAHEYYAARNGG